MFKPRCSRSRAAAFSLIEMLATVAALVIVLGLMVSLARYVRRQASEQFTKQLLAQLDVLMQQYQARHQMLPEVPPFVPGAVAQALPANAPRAGKAPQKQQPPPPSSPQTAPSQTKPALPLLPASSNEDLPPEIVLRQNAGLNNRAVLQALRVEARRFPQEYASLPHSFFAEDTFRDAWGMPIVFMPGLHPAVGMAMQNRPFFLSAGPDRRFRTLEDNLFSYEEDTSNAQ